MDARTIYDIECLGWLHGASFKPMSPNHLGNHTAEHYERGYIAGQKARREYREQCAERLGVKLNHIRLMTE